MLSPLFQGWEGLPENGNFIFLGYVPRPRDYACLHCFPPSFKSLLNLIGTLSNQWFPLLGFSLPNQLRHSKISSSREVVCLNELSARAPRFQKCSTHLKPEVPDGYRMKISHSYLYFSSDTTICLNFSIIRVGKVLWKL